MWLDAQIDRDDRKLLRDLALRVAAISATEENAARWDLWRRHNRLEQTRPLVKVSPEGSWDEIFPESALECGSELSRFYELDLRKRLYHWDYLRDDTYIAPTVHVPIEFVNTRWGVNPAQIAPDEERGAWKYDHPIKTTEDSKLIKAPAIEIDEVASRRRLEIVRDLFGDILEVKQARTLWDLGLDTYIVDSLVALRGNQQFLEDMFDRPEWVHEVLGFMTDSTIDLIDHLAENVQLEMNNGATCDGLGFIYITDELPAGDFDGEHVRPRDLWNVSNAQEFTGVSPDMHYEFGLQYQIRIAEKFGLNSYGCCEPLDRKLDYVKMIPGLRRVSISPWADVRRSAEGLLGDYVFSWKPNPACVAGDGFDAGRIRNEIRETIRIAREHGCVLEMILKDTHTVRQQPRRLQAWVEIAKEEAGAECLAAR